LGDDDIEDSRLQNIFLQSPHRQYRHATFTDQPQEIHHHSSITIFSTRPQTQKNIFSPVTFSSPPPCFSPTSPLTPQDLNEF
jgi:hypothetical protein